MIELIDGDSNASLCVVNGYGLCTFRVKEEVEIKKEPEEVETVEKKFDGKSKSPKESKKESKESKRTPKRSPKLLSPKESRSEQAKPIVDRKIKTEPNDRSCSF